MSNYKNIMNSSMIDERMSNIEKHFAEMSKGMNTLQKKALGLTIDEFDLSRTLYVFRTNKKAFQNQIKSNVIFLKAKHARVK